MCNAFFSMFGLGWLAYVRTDYRDSTNNESHKDSLMQLKWCVSLDIFAKKQTFFV